MKSNGILFILSSPSGGGKTTIANSIVKNDPNTRLSVSYTTRKKREGEMADKDYHFINETHFMQLVAEEKFLEYAKIYDHLYGTPKDHINDIIQSGKDVIFDIDWQGSHSIKTQLPDHTVSVFILPPSFEALKQRLINRNQDSTTNILQRISEAKLEIAHYTEYDYIIVNDNLEETIAKITNILHSERLKRSRIQNLADFILKL